MHAAPPSTSLAHNEGRAGPRTALTETSARAPLLQVYCAHEYTQSNARFALTVEPNNAALKARAAEVAALREKGQPTIPSTMAVEKATNPFLRPDSADLQARLRISTGDPCVCAPERESL